MLYIHLFVKSMINYQCLIETMSIDLIRSWIQVLRIKKISAKKILFHNRSI